ncbi:MAG: alanine racemase [Armatimonadetes bacterium]|nr:alanine racemase [Armatimonadota bacterium]MDE2205883.1 alanine racemase [Armatimonadota bacterium]
MNHEDSSRIALRDIRTWVEIDLDTISANVRSLCAAVAPAEVMAVVKADAYGHGMEHAAKAALLGGATWLGVATSREAISLRKLAPAVRICLLAPFRAHEAGAIAAAGITPLVGTGSPLRSLSTGRQGTRVHLEVDTGMGRSGALPTEVIDAYDACVAAGLDVQGLASHFAAAGGDDALTMAQLASYRAALSELEARGAAIAWRHICNSAGVLALGAAGCNLVRTGLLVYGIIPNSPAQPKLRIAVRPALTWYARIAAIRHLPAGSTISYDATFTLRRASQVATVQVGYGDGYPIGLSSKGHLLVRGQVAPILGRICMDQLMVDVTDVPAVECSDVCVCIGTSGELQVTVTGLAAASGLPEHTITTGITGRVPRIYRGGDACSTG